MIDGKLAEDIFRERMEAIGREVTLSTTEEDMFEHIDFYVDGVTFDVKGEKKLRRSDDNVASDIVWMEMRNVRGNKGWLCSNVNKIAFYRNGQFLVFDRNSLLEFIREFVGFTPIGKRPEYRKLYQRKGRKDLLTYVYFSDIQHLVEEVI